MFTPAVSSRADKIGGVATSMTDPLVGHTVDGRYHVVRRLARGGMATVYVAIDRRLDREIALKVMHPHLAEGTQGAAFESRFRREARAAAKLTHHNLVAVHDQGLDGEISYLVMELVEGENLRSRLHRRPPLTVSEALDITIEVLEALASVHGAGLVHRDIKPENVLLTQDGRVKVADFGLARAVTELTMAATGTVLGTVAYLSPELISDGNSDARSDVYAVGATLFEMLTGRAMFVGSSPIQIAVQHLSATPPHPSDVAAWIPAQIDELIAAMTAREADARLPNAEVALRAVRELRWSLSSLVLEHPVQEPAAEEPVVTDEASLSAELFDETAESRLKVPAETTALVTAEEDADDPAPAVMTSTQSLLVKPTVAQPTAASTHQVAEAAPRQSRRRSKIVALVLVLLLLGGAGATTWYLLQGPGAYTEVPAALLNADATIATDAIEEAGLQVKSATDYSDVVAAGKVISVSPSPGERVRKDSVVTVTVSQGIEHFTVPTGLLNERRKNVIAAIEEAGFEVGEIARDYYDDVDQGIVTEVSVPEGSQQPHNTKIDITVSRGKEPVTIPNLVGMTEEQAIAKAESLGLNVEIGKPRYDNTVEKDLVSRQNPAALSEGFRTDTVTIRLSLGPELVEVPDLVGQSETDAVQQLKSLGFQVDVGYMWDGQLGLVRFQDPRPGSELPKGSTVKITVL